MQIIRGFLRRIVLLPTSSGLTFATPAAGPSDATRPESVPRAVTCGFEQGACPPSRRAGRISPALRHDGGR